MLTIRIDFQRESNELKRRGGNGRDKKRGLNGSDSPELKKELEWLRQRGGDGPEL